MESNNHDSDPRPGNQESQNIGLRGLYMLLFVVAFGIGEVLVIFVAILQFLSLLIAGKFNKDLVRFGLSLSKWIADVTRFQTGVTEGNLSPGQHGPTELTEY